MRLILLVLSAFIVLNVNGQALISPIYSLKKDSISATAVPWDQVIHQSENHYILKSRLADLKSNDYYFLQLHPKLKDLRWLKDKGEVLTYKEGEFAILKPKDNDSLLEVAGYLHEKGGQCGTVQKLSDMPLSVAQFSPKPLTNSFDQPVADTLNMVELNNIIETVKTMVSWKTRYHEDSDGKFTAQKLKAMYETYLPSDRSDVEITTVPHSGSDQDSLLVRITGSENPDQVLILGSHLDSINNSNNKDAPGADDNASGTATNMEIFRVLMESGIVPKKTIEIHAYGAEEIGLVGSGEMADDYKSRNVDVQAMVQFDMNGYSRSGESKIYFVSNNTNSSLTNQLGRLVDTYLDISWGTQFLIFGSSDHASWNRRGYPVAFPTENPFAFNGEIHTANDTLENMNQVEQMAEFAKLGVAYFMHFAGY